MSTPAEIERRIDGLRRTRDDLLNEQELINSEIFTLRRRLNAAQDSGDESAIGAIESQLQSLRNRRDSIFSEYERLGREIDNLDQELSRAIRESAQRETSDSAATVVRSESAAQGAPAPVTTSPDPGFSRDPATGALRIDITGVAPDTANDDVTGGPRDGTGTNFGIDDPVRPINDTQSTSGPPNFGTPRSVDPVAPVATTRGGVGSGSDDQRASANETRSVVAARFSETIKPQPNVLDRYYSYSYVAELRMIRPEDLGRAIRNRSINFDSAGLLVRSGGAKAGAVNSYEQKRNQYFDLDFYIDNIKIKNHCLGSSGSAHAFTDISFTITEPNGISFIDRLYMAINDYIGIDNYAAAVMIMTIKFYGYDQNGNLQVVNNQSRENIGDPRAIVTKIIPFRLSEIGFRISNNLVTYDCVGVPIPYEAVSTDRGTVMRNIEISGGSVEEVLGRGTVSSAPPKASATSSPSNKAITSLVDALNEEQRKLVSNQMFDFADRYSIEFAEPIIASAQVNKQGFPDLSKTPMSSNENTQNVSSERQASDKTKRIQGISAGTPIVQAIETVIRNSTFVTDQADIVYDETTDQPIPISQNNRAFSWFKVNVQATPLQYDTKRNDYAYDIKYIISLYEIKGMDSPYFPVGRFSGVHKSYPYWFTGQNTAVLDYQATYNYAYSSVVSGSAADQAKYGTSNLQNIRRFSFAPRSSQNSAGAENRTNEVSASAAAYLYDQAALGAVSMKIIGDPAWMNQGELFPGIDANNFNYAPFLPDGSINFDSGEVLFEINWVKGQDYNINTGLVDLDPQRLGRDSSNFQSLVYTAREITSEFRGGSFTQQVDGDLYIFDIPATARENTALTVPETATVNNTQTRTPVPSNNSPRVPPPSAASDPTTDTSINPLYRLDDGAPQFDAFSQPRRRDPLPQDALKQPTSSGGIQAGLGLRVPPVAGSYGRFTTIDDTNDNLTITRDDLGQALNASLDLEPSLRSQTNRDAALRGGLTIINYNPQLMDKET
jgi:hypothetical protein